MKHVFVSYSRRDNKTTDHIVGVLRAAGYRVWMDRGGILGARLWRKEIVVAIKDAGAFLIVLSPSSVASRNVRKEVDLGEQYDKPLIPLIISKTEIPDEMQYHLAGLQQVDCCDNIQAGLQELEQILAGLIGKEQDTHDLPTSKRRESLWPFGRLTRVGLVAVLLLVLLGGATGLSVAIRQWMDLPALSAKIGITPLEVTENESIPQLKRLDHSSRLSEKLSAAFDMAGFEVQPRRFEDESALTNWTFDNWRVTKAKEIRPSLLLRNTVNRCSGGASTDEPQYVWLSEPFSGAFEPFVDFVRVSGSDVQILSISVAYDLIKKTRDYLELNERQREDLRKWAVQEFLSVARARGLNDQIEIANSLLGQPNTQDQEVTNLLEGLRSPHNACEQSASRNRRVQEARAQSYSTESAGWSGGT